MNKFLKFITRPTYSYVDYVIIAFFVSGVDHFEDHHQNAQAWATALVGMAIFSIVDYFENKLNRPLSSEEKISS